MVKPQHIGMLFVWVLIAIVALMQIVKDCSCGGRDRVRIDTLRIQGATVEVVKTSIVPQYRYKTDVVHDTIDRVIAKMDTLRIYLKNNGVEEHIKLDTTLQIPIVVDGFSNSLPVAILTDADCISRTITQRVRIQDNTIHTIRPTTNTVTSPSYSIGIGIQYGVGIDGKLFPSFGVQFSKILLSF